MEDLWHPHTSIAHLAKRLWVQGFLAGLGCVLLIVIVWALVRRIDTPPTPQESAATISLPQAGQASQTNTVPPITGTSLPSSDTAAVLKTQVAEVLTQVKEADQKKNLGQLLALYSSTFPDLQKKAEKITRSWEKCN